jgi:hypothetical protein
MDPAQMSTEAVRRLIALRSTSPITTNLTPALPGGEPLTDLFDELAVLDGWAKISRDRLLADLDDTRAAQELRRSLEQSARLHPAFIRRLVDVLNNRPAVKTSITVPAQAATGVPTPH